MRMKMGGVVKWGKTINVKMTSDYTRSFRPLKADILEKPDIKAKFTFKLLWISTHGADVRSRSPRGPQRSGPERGPRYLARLRVREGAGVDTGGAPLPSLHS